MQLMQSNQYILILQSQVWVDSGLGLQLFWLGSESKEMGFPTPKKIGEIAQQEVQKKNSTNVSWQEWHLIMLAIGK